MKRIVIKVGSAVLSEHNRISKDRLYALVEFIAKLKDKYDVLLVSSGAVSAGYTELKLDKSILANKQALASIGQPLLMRKYKNRFEKYNILIAQVLVTSSNFTYSEQESRVKSTIETLLENGVLPIINENDATATKELELGDNDQLSAIVATHLNADLLVILSDIDAYYDGNPSKNKDAKRVKIVTEISKEELNQDVTPNNTFATGGIVTKLKAADIVLKKNIDMFLASGFDLSDVSSFLLENKHLGGTLFTRR